MTSRARGGRYYITRIFRFEKMMTDFERTSTESCDYMRNDLWNWFIEEKTGEHETPQNAVLNLIFITSF